MGSPQEDHKLLTLSLQGMLDASGQQSRLRRTRYDRDKILTQAGRERLGQVLASFPQPSWDTEVDHHCKHFEDFIRRELDEHFTMPAAPARATYIPAEVWQLRDRKGQLQTPCAPQGQTLEGSTGPGFRPMEGQPRLLHFPCYSGSKVCCTR